jgi:hypothetical protein
MKTRKELYSEVFREMGGVYIHIDRNSKVLFGGGGFHRLAIAKILKLNTIPTQLGVVHKKAINSWKQVCLM